MEKVKDKVWEIEGMQGRHENGCFAILKPTSSMILTEEEFRALIANFVPYVSKEAK